VSDERVDADAAADGSGADDSQGGRTAVVTPQRPTGKRSRQRSEADADESGAVELTDSDSDDDIRKKAKKAKKAKKPGDPSGNPFLFVLTYLKQVVAELRKVIWPGRKELITYTTVVIVFVAVMVALVAGLDIAFAQGVLAVFG
jgi:preprotein translocase subunit SecE